MKNIVRNILFIAVAALYIFCTMGFGVHKCSSEGTASLILLCGSVPCESVHSHESSSLHNHEESECCHKEECCHTDEFGHSHSNDCCSTNVYIVSYDQTASEYDIDINPQVVDLCCFTADIQKIISVSRIAGDSYFYQHPRDCVSQASQAVLCTFIV